MEGEARIEGLVTYLKKWRARGGLELPTFWFVAIGVKMLNALFGVAYGLETPFFPQVAAPNPAPKFVSIVVGFCTNFAAKTKTSRFHCGLSLRDVKREGLHLTVRQNGVEYRFKVDAMGADISSDGPAEKGNASDDSQ
jgi:hypothetical protein